MKKIILVLVILAIGFFVYWSGVYTYFIKTEVQETLPTPTNQTQGTPNEPKTLASGTFGEIDFIHKGSGTAKLVEVDGKQFVRLEDFSVTSGPDLYVYLSNSSAPTNDIESLGDFVNLGLLKGTQGNQNYELPVGTEDYQTVVIWCKKFSVLFTYAVMK